MAKADDANAPQFIGDIRNKESIPQSMVEQYPELNDFYNKLDEYAVTAADKEDYEKYLNRLDENEKAALSSGKNYYELNFSNIGGLVMPLIVEFEYVDGTRDLHRIPAEIWKSGKKSISKVFVTTKEARAIHLDPHLETADVDVNNNHWPPVPQPSRFQLYKSRSFQQENPMQRSQRSMELEKGGTQ